MADTTTSSPTSTSSTTASPVTPTPPSPKVISDDDLKLMSASEIDDPALLMRRIGLHLKEADGLESNIGVVNHDYWNCVAKYRLLTSK